ncbi:MAG TPA: nucleotidyltransferase family protein [Candidatus Polarisedimenticolaceae bacterium]|nr:nucleotidyltransferase family protein [Candidatus Polarisedimenticolaceae bacterium]
MDIVEVAGEELDPREAAVYQRALDALSRAGVPSLVGGAYAFASYTGIVRHTKDFDLFLRRRDVDTALRVLEGAGARGERTFPHWLAKAHFDDGLFVDLIHSSGNGVATVDELWFRHAAQAEVLGRSVRLCPAEEILWSKAFVQERERYDGADVMHLLHARAEHLDWERLVRRFGEHWRVLLSHLVLFGFVYPSERARIPATVMEGLLRRLERESRAMAPGERLCRGTLLSRLQYLPDLRRERYRDARTLSAADLAPWSAAGEREEAERREG